ncbi:hypothetical protein B0A52_04026 [Exophiala mesophila]|uniref:DNA repair protein RAD50 n=1 Tax=Exophiala mesophila TaxID=212818 RepID=A0A438NA41_EXOME|nr:hypothetical protein B0A52_04026 [Exophiala mesophila]
MSRLLQMSIAGIRSFPPDKNEVIKFDDSPLTLIVGFNGSGKTTIIECLKFAFTGMQPPNTKVGGAFVHDPKMRGESTVLALVKVQFTASDGAKMVVARRLQLQVKKASRSLKTLEGSLRTVHNGETITTSSRVAALDQLMPLALGVSTAVLDNVIFCHQDESLWPLSDPATLKKKFDEIFEAQKYTKAIDNIKTIRKSHNEELAKYKILEEHAKADKDRAIKAQKNAERLQQEVETLRSRVEDHNVRITKARKLADEAWRKGEEYAKILGSLEGKRIEARGKRETIDGLRNDLEEVSESDEWLQNTLRQFQTRQQELKEDMQEKQEKYIDLQDMLKMLGQQKEEQTRYQGKFEQERDEHERQVRSRRETVKKLAAKHQIRGYDDMDDEVLVEEFRLKIRKMAKDQAMALERVKAENTAERSEASSLVNRLTERKRALQENKVGIKRQIDTNDREAAGFQRNVDGIKVDEGTRAIVESRIEDLNKKLEQARQAAREADWDKKLSDMSVELHTHEETHSRLNDELVQSMERANDFAKVSHLKQELKDRQRSLKTLLDTHGGRVSQIVSQEWNASNIEGIYQDVLNNAHKEAMTATRERDDVARDLEHVQYKLKTLRDDLSGKKAQVSKNDKQIRLVVEGGAEEYEEALRNAEAEVDVARDDSMGFAGLHDYLQKILETADGPSPACRTCQRGFKKENDPHLPKMRRRITDLIEKTKSQIDAANVKELEVQYRRLLDLGTVVETWKKLVEVEIPHVEGQVADLTEQRDKLVGKIEKHDKIVEQREEAKRDVESIGRTITSISQSDREISAFTKDVEDLSAKQGHVNNGRTLSEIREAITTATDKMKGAQNQIARLRSEQEQSRSNISSMEIELREKRGEVDRIDYQLSTKAAFAKRVEENRDKNRKLRENLDELDRDVEGLDPEISTANAKYEDIDQRSRVKERELSLELSEVNASVHELNMLSDLIQAYKDRGGPSQLGQVKRELDRIEGQINEAKADQGNLTQEMNLINDRIRDADATRRKYSDNLRYRHESRSLEKLEEEIQELSSRNAEVDRSKFERESDKYTKEHNRLSAEQSGLMGEMKSKDAQLGDLLRDYEIDLKDAPGRYKEAHIKVEVTKAAVEDLARYGGALDKAIMKYHGLKMDEINKIVEELWRATYQGSDIDSIAIRADNETGRLNRSYNYRVVMVKRNVEMDMRGRCSAGQRVLASIIIRLALAECFSSKCGIIALDEPTTNLDRENIESLARSLSEIIKYRREQSNFQLLVITHDEDFLRSMDCGQFTDYYYRVSRNSNADSIIERQRIAEVL